jgi:hypothetical protein
MVVSSAKMEVNMNQSNCSYCGERKGYIVLSNKQWCEVCWEDAQNNFNKNYEELLERRYLIKGMRDAGWQITMKGNMYYPDDEHSNVFHISF